MAVSYVGRTCDPTQLLFLHGINYVYTLVRTSNVRDKRLKSNCRTAMQHPELKAYIQYTV